MVDVEQIRIAQEQRLLPVLKAWDEAKEHLEDAIARAKAREQEFHEISDDVRRNISALDLVLSMAKGSENRTPAASVSPSDANRPRLIAGDEPPRREVRDSENTETSSRGFGGLMRKSSRPLFASVQRSA